MSLPTNSYHSSTFSAAGTLTVTPPGENHVERISFAGAAAGAYNIALAIDGLHFPGDRIVLAMTWPIMTAGIAISVYSGTVTGSPIATFTPDGVNLTGAFEFVYNSSFAWEYQRSKVPA